MANPLLDWRVTPQDVVTVGKDLRRAECVLAEPSGDLWAADLRGGVMRICPDGTQQMIQPGAEAGPFADPDGPVPPGTRPFVSLPNGLCFDDKGDFVIANFGMNRIEHLGRDGSWSPMFDTVQGQSIGKANFPTYDSKGRLWFSVTCSQQAWESRIAGEIQSESDGVIVLVDDSGARIVATDLWGANELRFDPAEEWIYVAETGADRFTRFRIAADGSLRDREIYGPPKLGGAPDGFAFDAYGNLWTTLIATDRVAVITPEGDVLTVYEDGDAEAKDALSRAMIDGNFTPAQIGAASGRIVQRMASITFGGPDLRTVYIGSLMGRTLPSFRSPVPGRPLLHWR